MKFIFHNHPGFCRSSAYASKRTCLERTLSHSTHSTVQEEDASSLESIEYKRKLPCRVRFQDQIDVIPDDNRHEKDMSACWYNRQEFEVFRRDTLALAQQFVMHEQQCHEKYEGTSTGILWHAYQGFCSVQTSADITAVLNRTPSLKMSHETVGLDRWIIPAIGQDKLERRKRIVRQVQSIEKLFKYDVQQRQDRIRQISRSISQPSRLYAHHVAQLAVRAGNGETAHV